MNIETRQGTNEQLHSSEQEMMEVIHSGSFMDHPEVESWWVSLTDPITASPSALKKNILQTATPEDALTDCGNIVFPDMPRPLHFHAGIDGYQKSKLFKVIDIGLEDYSEMGPHAHKMFERATAVAAIHLKEQLSETAIKKLEDASEQDIPEAIRGLAEECMETFKRLYPESHTEHHHDHTHAKDPEHTEQVKKLTWDQRFEHITNVMLSLGQNPRDVDVQKQFALLAGNGYLGAIDINEKLPKELQETNRILTESFRSALKALRLKQDISEDTLASLLIRIHDPNVHKDSMQSVLEKKTLTSRDALTVLAYEMVLTTRPKATYSIEERKLMEKAVALHKKGLFYVNITLSHKTAYHMELTQVLDGNGRPVVGNDGQPLMRVGLCPHSHQADQTLTQVHDAVTQHAQLHHDAYQLDTARETSHASLGYDYRLMGYPPVFPSVSLELTDTISVKNTLVPVSVQSSPPMYVSAARPMKGSSVHMPSEQHEPMPSHANVPSGQVVTKVHVSSVNNSQPIRSEKQISVFIPHPADSFPQTTKTFTQSENARVSTQRTVNAVEAASSQPRVTDSTKAIKQKNVSVEKDTRVSGSPLSGTRSSDRSRHAGNDRLSSSTDVPRSFTRGEETGIHTGEHMHTPDIVIGKSLEEAFKKAEHEEISTVMPREVVRNQTEGFVHASQAAASPVTPGIRNISKREKVTKGEEEREQKAEQGVVQAQATDAPVADSIPMKTSSNQPHHAQQGYYLTLALDDQYIPLEPYTMKQTFEALLHGQLSVAG